MDDTAITWKLERIRNSILNNQRSIERLQEEVGGMRDALEEVRDALSPIIKKLGDMASNPNIESVETE